MLAHLKHRIHAAVEKKEAVLQVLIENDVRDVLRKRSAEHFVLYYHLVKTKGEEKMHVHMLVNVESPPEWKHKEETENSCGFWEAELGI